MIIGLSGHIGSGKDLVAKMIKLLTLYNNPPKHISKHIVNSWRNFRKDTTDIIFAEEMLKDIYGSRFTDLSEWSNRKFAAKLKQMVSLLTGIPVADLEKPEVKNSELGPEWRRAGWRARGFINTQCDEPITVRHLLQVLGTNAVRDVVHPNAWVNALFTDYVKEGYTSGLGDFHELKGFPNWIISDMRFPNEMEAVKARGGITVRINRVKYLTEPVYSEDKLQSARWVEMDFSTKHPSETALDLAKFDYVINNDAGIPELLEQVKQMLIHFKLI